MDPIDIQYRRIRQKYPDAPELDIWHGVAIDFYIRQGTIPTEVLVQSALARAEGYDYKYRPDQLRVPAGNPDGGQWTDEGGGGGDGGEDPDSEELPITQASLRDKIRSVARLMRLWRNRRRNSPKPPEDEPSPEKNPTNKPENIVDAPPSNRPDRPKPEPYSPVPDLLTPPSAPSVDYTPENDPLTPGGVRIGTRGSSNLIREVTPREYEALKRDLLTNAEPLPNNGRYEGTIYQRPDGTKFGIRESRQNKETIDVFETRNPLLQPNTKVHQHDPQSKP
jgi:hypothetical protein